MNMDCQREDGRDEMNLSEIPITVLADRVTSGVKSLIFKTEFGTLTVSGSDAYGLPTAPDADVIVGLIQLTKQANNFTCPEVPFTRYELLKVIGWPDMGRHWQRLDDSLRRWTGVTLFYEGAWWDNTTKCRVDASFHILEDVTTFDMKARRTMRARQQPLPLSTFTWGKKFFASCRADNLKRLDVETYFALNSAITKQMYRFLDKRFHQRPDWTFDLRAFAFGHVGLSQNYSDGKLKEKLTTALDELKAIGFLKSATYASPKRGTWTIRLVGKSKGNQAGERVGGVL
jgi:plasmid replication initiation protein